MKTTATPQEVIAKTYLNITDVQILLGMTREANKKSAVLTGTSA